MSTHSTNVYLPTTFYEPNARHRDTMVDKKRHIPVLMEVSQWFFRTKMPALNVHFSLDPILSSQAEASHLTLGFLFYLFTYLVALDLSCGRRAP